MKGQRGMKQSEEIEIKQQSIGGIVNRFWLSILLGLAVLISTSYAEQPPAPCFPNPRAARDSALVRNRGDIRNLPEPLKERIVRMADRPHSILPTQAFAEADKSQPVI
jgi:hypothetical protein